MTPLDSALACVRAGWHVFPVWGCAPDGSCLCGDPHDGSNPRRQPKDAGKHPVTPAAPRGHRDATADELVARRWWAEHPDAGVAVALASSGLAVLDVDVADGRRGAESLAAFEAEHGPMPPTLAARTGSGGFHAFCSLPEGVPARRKISFRPGLDLIADGYAIVAPSTHHSGGRYEWISGDPPVPLPGPLADVLRAGPDRAAAAPYEGGRPASPGLLEHAWRRLLQHGPSVKGEGGDKHAFQVGTILLCDYDLQWDDAWRLASAWNDHFSENQWAPDRLAVKLRNGCAYAGGVRGCARMEYDTAVAVTRRLAKRALEPPPGAAPAEVDFMAEVRRAYDDILAHRAGGAPSEAPRPLFTPAAGLLDREFPGADWLVRGILPDRSFGMVGGEPKSDKTWIVIELALAVATNTPVFGEFDTGPARPVALFLAEDAERAARNRLRALAAARGMEPADALRNVSVSCRAPLDVRDDAQLARLVASCRVLPAPPALVVVDPLREVHGANEDSSDEMIDVLGRFKAVRDILGCAVIAVHHTAKISADVSRRRYGQKLRGSGAIHGAIDAGLYVGNMDTDGVSNWTTDVQVETRAARAAGVFKLHLQVEDDAGGEAVSARWHVGPAGGGKADRKETDASAVTSALARCEKGESTSRELRESCGLGWQNMQAALADLESRGCVEKITRGARQVGWRLAGPLLAQARAEGSTK